MWPHANRSSTSHSSASAYMPSSKVTCGLPLANQNRTISVAPESVSTPWGISSSRMEPVYHPGRRPAPPAAAARVRSLPVSVDDAESDEQAVDDAAEGNDA